MVGAALSGRATLASAAALTRRTIPSSGEQLPLIGLAHADLVRVLDSGDRQGRASSRQPGRRPRTAAE
jgi:hypothetical protein